MNIFKINILSLLLVLFSLFNCGKNTSQNENNNATKTSLPDVQWEVSSLMQIDSEEKNTENIYYSYPRMIELQDGRLLIVFENNGNIYASYSQDKGNSWSSKKIIAEKRNNINATVPELIQLKTGELLIAYNLRPAKNSNGEYDKEKKFSIAIKKSIDAGNSWNDEKILYEAGYHFENGCWEPAFAQLPDGKLYLLFANEARYTNSNEQEISVLQSLDNGNTWSTDAQVISFASGYRDGMPVSVITNNGKLYVAIEDNSDGGEFKPSIITIDLPWDGKQVDKVSSKRKKVLRDVFARDVYAGAPYLRQLHSGEFMLSVQSTFNRNKEWNLSNMNMIVFDKKFSEYKFLDNPFPIPTDKSALWNSFLLLKDNKTVIALTSTNAYNNYNAIWIKKGIIKYQNEN